MYEKVLQYFIDRFNNFGYGSYVTFSEICFYTKLKSTELNPILDDLIMEGKIIRKTGEHTDLYILKVI